MAACAASTDYTRCTLGGATSTAHFTCASSACNKACPAGVASSGFTMLSQVCNVANEPCTGGKTCSATGYCGFTNGLACTFKVYCRNIAFVFCPVEIQRASLFDDAKGAVAGDCISNFCVQTQQTPATFVCCNSACTGLSSSSTQNVDLSSRFNTLSRVCVAQCSSCTSGTCTPCSNGPSTGCPTTFNSRICSALACTGKVYAVEFDHVVFFFVLMCSRIAIGRWLVWLDMPAIHCRHAGQVRLRQHVRHDRLFVLHELDGRYGRCLHRCAMQEGVPCRPALDDVRRSDRGLPRRQHDSGRLCGDRTLHDWRYGSSL
jgi:hypothetical protein